jgi:hypothetical protein
MMCCASPQIGKCVIPGTLQSLAFMQLVVSLQAPGEHHFGAMLCRSFQSKFGLRMFLVPQTENVRLSSSRLLGARKATNLQVLIMALQEDFGLACCPLRICRNVHSSHSMQDLRNAQQVLLHGQSLSVHSPYQVPGHSLKEHHSHLAPEGLALVDPVFSPCQGLVLGYVQDHIGLARQCIHETFAEHRFDIVPPCNRPVPSSDGGCSMRLRNLIVQEALKVARQVESFPIYE